MEGDPPHAHEGDRLYRASLTSIKTPVHLPALSQYDQEPVLSESRRPGKQGEVGGVFYSIFRCLSK